MKKRTLTAIICAMLAAVMVFSLAACGDSSSSTTSAADETTAAAADDTADATADSDYVKANGKIIVGITDFAPMDYKENNEWVGFDADLAKLFAEKLGVEIEFTEIDWDNKILDLDAKTIDCVWNGMTLTDEVEAAMECTDTYALNAQVVVMSKDKLADYADVESMKDLVFAAEAGSAGEAVATEEGLQVNSVQNQAAALMEVAAGTSDACVIDKTMADAMTGEGTSYDVLGYSVSLSSEEYVVGFRKGSDLAELLNGYFKEWKEDGTLKDMAEKYDNAVSLAE